VAVDPCVDAAPYWIATVQAVTKVTAVAPAFGVFECFHANLPSVNTDGVYLNFVSVLLSHGPELVTIEMAHAWRVYHFRKVVALIIAGIDQLHLVSKYPGQFEHGLDMILCFESHFSTSA
jgi:hypothetical protein